MSILIGIIIIGLFLFTSCMINFFNNEELKRQIKILKNALKAAGIDVPETTSTEATSPTINVTKKDAVETRENKPIVESSTFNPPKKILKIAEKSKFSLEQQFGAKIPVWIGGISLALAGFFLVKYSFENNLLTPPVRVTIGVILGFSMIYCGKKVREKTGFSNGERISQSITGAGIAVLYIVSFASVQLYELIPVFAGLIAMTMVTAIALILSLRHGAPIAFLGMIFGFITPALINTNSDNTITVFISLYFMTSGIVVISKKIKCWSLSIITILASLLWIAIWLAYNYQPNDSILFFFFLIGVSITIIINSKDQYAEDGGGTLKGAFTITSILNYIGLGGALIMMGIIVGKSGFGFLEISLLALLSISSIILAYFNDKLYGFTPCVAIIISLTILLVWDNQNHQSFAITLLVFASIFSISSFLLMFKSRTPILWAGITASSSLSYYLLAFFKMNNHYIHSETPLLWSLISFFLGICSIIILFKTYTRFSKYIYKQQLYTIFTVSSSSFILISLTILLSTEILSVAVAGQIMVVLWINNKISIKSLLPISVILTCVFGLLIFPQAIEFIKFILLAIFNFESQNIVTLQKSPLFQIGMPALMFLASAYLLRKYQNHYLVELFETISITLIFVMLYFVLQNIINLNQYIISIKDSFTQRGVITNIFFIYGLSCFWVGRKYERIAFSISAIFISGIAGLRILYFDMILYNPLWADQKIIGTILFNSLLITFGIPIIWASIVRKELLKLEPTKVIYSNIFILILLFSLVNANIRHIFHGEYLNASIITNPEIYSYSFVWLILAIIILLVGILKENKTLRFVSLGLVLITVTKVFLIDASELEGLYRVFSFFGLGVSLIGLSYFYTKFVFNEDSGKNIS